MHSDTPVNLQIDSLGSIKVTDIYVIRVRGDEWLLVTCAGCAPTAGWWTALFHLTAAHSASDRVGSPRETAQTSRHALQYRWLKSSIEHNSGIVSYQINYGIVDLALF